MTEELFYTPTMANIYAQQKDFEGAVKVYKYLIDKSPYRDDLKIRLKEAKAALLMQRKEKVRLLIAQWINMALDFNRLKKLKEVRQKDN